MNICFVNSTHKWGGVKSWTLDLARVLGQRGHEILVVGRPGPFLEKAAHVGIPCQASTFGMDFSPIQIAKFLRLFTSHSFDLVVVNVGKDMRTAGIAAAMLGIPVMHRVGLAGDMENTFKVRAMHKWIAPRLLAPCEQVKTGVLRKLPFIAPEEIAVILTGKEPGTLSPKSKNTPPRLVSTSQLNKDKGHADVLHALSILRKQGRILEYHIAGTGKIEQELKELASDLGLGSQVIWHGFLKNVRDFVRQFDIFVLPSHVEGLPNALLEAMAEGLVCIARNVGGVEEVWPGGAGHLLLPRQASPVDFARVLTTLQDLSEPEFLELSHSFWNTAKANSLTNMVEAFELFASQLVHDASKNNAKIKHMARTEKYEK